MKALVATAGLLFLVVGVGAQDDAEVKKDKELLKGEWKLESFENQQGKQDAFEGATLELKVDGSLVFSKGGETKKGTYTINPAGKPREIDIKPECKDQAITAIYKLDKETLTLCVPDGPGAARPNEFAAKDGCALITLKRSK